MRNNLYQTICFALEHPGNKDLDNVPHGTIQQRVSEELNWLDGDSGRECLVSVLWKLGTRMRSEGIVIGPGISCLPDSLILRLIGVTSINPLKWNLPFASFSNHVQNGAEITFEAGSGCLDVAREVISSFGDELIATEIEPGLFNLQFINGILLTSITLRIVKCIELNKLSYTARVGWHKLERNILIQFGWGYTGGSLWYETDIMREWLKDFLPESMSDLAMLLAMAERGDNQVFHKLMHRKNNYNEIPSTGNAVADGILSETYGTTIYQEQAVLLKEVGLELDEPAGNFPFKGHCIGRAMVANELLWALSNR